MKRPVKTIRIDLPSRGPEFQGSFAYFFIDAPDDGSGPSWWNKPFNFLLDLERQPVGLSPDGEEMEIAFLTGKKRQEFLELLRTAPESEVAEHRTLRAALRRLSEHELDVPVRYFGPVFKPQSNG